MTLIEHFSQIMGRKKRVQKLDKKFTRSTKWRDRLSGIYCQLMTEEEDTMTCIENNHALKRKCEHSQSSTCVKTLKLDHGDEITMKIGSNFSGFDQNGPKRARKCKLQNKVKDSTMLDANARIGRCYKKQ